MPEETCKLIFLSPKDLKKRLEAAFQLNVYTMWYVEKARVICEVVDIHSSGVNFFVFHQHQDYTLIHQPPLSRFPFLTNTPYSFPVTMSCWTKTMKRWQRNHKTYLCIELLGNADETKGSVSRVSLLQQQPVSAPTRQEFTIGFLRAPTPPDKKAGGTAAPAAVAPPAAAIVPLCELPYVRTPTRYQWQPHSKWIRTYTTVVPPATTWSSSLVPLEGWCHRVTLHATTFFSMICEECVMWDVNLTMTIVTLPGARHVVRFTSGEYPHRTRFTTISAGPRTTRGTVEIPAAVVVGGQKKKTSRAASVLGDLIEVDTSKASGRDGGLVFQQAFPLRLLRTMSRFCTSASKLHLYFRPDLPLIMVAEYRNSIKWTLRLHTVKTKYCNFPIMPPTEAHLSCVDDPGALSDDDRDYYRSTAVTASNEAT